MFCTENAASVLNRRQESPSPHRNRQRLNRNYNSDSSYNQGYNDHTQKTSEDKSQEGNSQQNLNWQQQLFDTGSGYSNHVSFDNYKFKV